MSASYTQGNGLCYPTLPYASIDKPSFFKADDLWYHVHTPDHVFAKLFLVDRKFEFYTLALSISGTIAAEFILLT
jgi:hypothetical protein